jgi:ABC-type branched-subunit amino acid transport system ATPase component
MARELQAVKRRQETGQAPTHQKPALDAEVGMLRDPQQYQLPQNRFLFSSLAHGRATVADNIRFGRPEASRVEVEAAAFAIGAEPVIRALPPRLRYQVGERGARLSAGERQLVAFARAWLADPALLILDEATSNLDVATERRVQQACGGCARAAPRSSSLTACRRWSRRIRLRSSRAAAWSK